MLANAEPGVTFGGAHTAGQDWVRPFDYSSINQFSVNGGISNSNDFQMDGSPNNSITFGAPNIGYVPPVASVQEMKLITNPYDAQYGHTGGAIFDMVTKYGGNQLHGQVYENSRRKWMAANTELNDDQKLPLIGFKRDQYGFELDGPVVIPHLYDGHNKTFFELETQIWRETDPYSGVSSVPALSPGSTTQPAWETGDFSGAFYWNGSGNSQQNIYNPHMLSTNGGASYSNVDNVLWPGLGMRQQFSSGGNLNVMPASAMDPTAKAILKYLPLPNRPTPSSQSWGADNYAWAAPATLPYDNVVARLDRNFGANDRTYLRFAWSKNWQNNADPGNGFQGPASNALSPLVFQNHFLTADWQHTFNTSSLFDLHVTLSRFAYNQNQGPSPFSLSNIGLSSLDTSVTQQVFPAISIGGVGGVSYFGNNAANGGNKLTISNSVAVMPMWTYIHGAHTIKAGLDFRMQRSSSYTGGAASGEFNDGCFWTAEFNWYCSTGAGSGLASFLTGVMDGGDIYTGVRQYFTYPYYALFVQDDWKLTHKLTVNLGLRWDLQLPPTESANKVVGAFDSKDVNPIQSTVSSALPANVTLMGGMTYAGVNGQPRGQFSTDRILIQPRLGFNYALDNKTVIRGGIGTTYSQYTGQGYNQGFTTDTAYTSSVDYGQSTYGGTLLSNPFPSIAKPSGSKEGMLNSLGNNFNVVNPNFKIPGVVNYSLGIERQIGSHTTVDLSYVGNRGFDMASSSNLNPISRQYAASCNMEMGASTATYSDCINDTGLSNHWVSNPFAGVAAFSPAATGNLNNYYYASQLPASIYTRPYPEFGDITQTQGNDGNTEYDSMQAVVSHNWHNALIFHGNFVWSKQMDDGWWNDQVYGIRQHYLDKTDRRWRFAANADWHLPVGKGRAFLGNSNRLVDAAVGGWTIGAILTYEAGTPSGVGMPFESRFEGYNLEVVHKQHYGVHNRVETQHVIRGSSKCVGWYDPNPAQDDQGGLSVHNAPYTLSDANGNDYSGCQVNAAGNGHVYDYILRPSFAAVQNVSDSGVRNPNGQNLDLSMSKSFDVYKTMKLQMRFEGYNVLNHPAWQGEDYWWDPWDPHFGTINKYYDGQTNIPRNIQLSAKVIW